MILQRCKELQIWKPLIRRNFNPLGRHWCSSCLCKISYIRDHIKYFFTSRLPRQIKLVWKFSDIMQATINGRALSSFRPYSLGKQSDKTHCKIEYCKSFETFTVHSIAVSRVHQPPSGVLIRIDKKQACPAPVCITSL